MDFLEDLFDGLKERKKYGKHKHGHYDNHYEHDEHNYPKQNAQGVFCAKCSVQNMPGSKFCTNCGTPMKVVISCHNCGVKLPPNSSFCNECGTKL